MYSGFVKLNDGIYKVYRVIMMVLMLVMSVWVFLEVVFREAGVSVPWLEEFTIYAFSWITYFGAAYVLRNDGHLSVTAVTGMIKNEKVLRVIAIIRNLIVLVFCCVVTYYTAQMVMVYQRNGNVSNNIRWVKMSYIFFQIPLNYLVYCLFEIEKVWGLLNGKKEVA